jgi:hypothetical protein
MRSVSALVGFLVGSGLYGTAWDLNSLIAFRVLTAVPGSIVPVLTMVTVIAGLFLVPKMARSSTVRKFGWGYLTFGHIPSAIIVVAPTKKHWQAGRTDSGTTSQAMANANAFLLGPRTCQSKGFT